MVDLIDVSSWQDPPEFDWRALANREPPVSAIVARATYGKDKLDGDFKKFSEQIRANGFHFGAYLFYRQVHTVRDQLAAFMQQLDLIGGLMMGDVLPTLDMEHNGINGDGEPIPARFSADCQEIAEALTSLFGGCILYYSSFFPSYLNRGGMQRHLWMQGPDYHHWLADYGRPAGQPRTPYTPKWALHQYTGKGRIAEYDEGKTDLDLNVKNLAVDWNELLIGNLPELEQEAVELETAVNARRGGAGDRFWRA